MASENDLQNSVCEYLEVKGYWFWRQNTAPSVQKQGDKMWFRRMPKYARKGIPDVHILTKRGVVYLEIKSLVGRLSPEQKIFQAKCAGLGVEYHVIKNIDEVMKIL